MKFFILMLSLIFLFENQILCQGYLRNDAVTTHISGITINEISAWSNPVDYNADGLVEGGDKDEYIELVNSSESAININNWTIATGSDEDLDLFTFPDTSILPKKALILFCRRPADISNFDPERGNIVLSAGNNLFRLANFNAEAVGIKNTNNLYISVHWREGTVNSGFLASAPTLVGTDVALDDNWSAGQSQARNPDYTGSWSQHPVIPGTVNWSNDNPTITLTNPQGSPGRKTGQDIPLPVELTLFKASAVDGNIQLYWETVSENENLGFILQRSDGDPFNFYEIGSYKDRIELKGSGSSSERKTYHYTDKYLISGITYYYKLIDVDMNGTETVQGTVSVVFYPEFADISSALLPETFSLNQNYPNPFNPETHIGFNIPSIDDNMIDIKLTIYNQLGKAVKVLYDGPISPGEYKITWNGRDDNFFKVPSGIYIYHLSSMHFTSSRKMLLVK